MILPPIVTVVDLVAAAVADVYGGGAAAARVDNVVAD